MARARGTGGANTAVAAVQQLQGYQALILLVADADMGELHPSLGLPTATPLATLALWDNERLKKLGRMKAEPNSPKDIVRGFAKLVLALRELSDTANGQDVPRAFSSSIPAAATSVYLPPLHAGALEPLPLVPVAKFHSGKRSRAAPAKSAEHKQGCHDIFLDCESRA